LGLLTGESSNQLFSAMEQAYHMNEV
jgi:hypothetical protein